MRSRIIAVMSFLVLSGIGVSAALRQSDVGVIEGVVIEEGTSEPIAEVRITINGGNRLDQLLADLLGPNATPQQIQETGQSLLDLVDRGAALPPDLIQAAQEFRQGNTPRGNSKTAELSATTDSSGHFRIENVPAGDANLRAQIKGYFAPLDRGVYSNEVEQKQKIEARKVTTVQLRMVRGGTLSGRVVNPSGKPLVDATVQILQPGYDKGKAGPQFLDQKVTDDRGEYRSIRLPPGDYYVMASSRAVPSSGGGAGSLAEVIVPTLYPDATAVEASQTIKLGPGDEVSGINIRVRTAPAAKVAGSVLTSLPPGPVVGQRGQSRPFVAGIALMQRDTVGLSEFNGGGGIVLNGRGLTAAPDGSFSISNVPSGTYDVFARLPVAARGGWGPSLPPDRATTPWAIGRTVVTVNGMDVDGVVIPVEPGVDLEGQLIVDGKRAGGDLAISLLPDDNALNVNDGQMTQIYGQIQQYSPAIGVDGTFTFPLIPEGPYTFRTSFAAPARPARGQSNDAAPPVPLPDSAYVADIRQGGISVYDRGIRIGRRDANPIEVLVNTNGGIVEGTVVVKDDSPASGMTVVLVPTSDRRGNVELFRNVASDASGRFSISRIPPGQYTLFASRSIPLAAFQNEKIVEKYSSYGTRLTIRGGSPVRMTLRTIPGE